MMKITKRQLSRIIKEEAENLLDYENADEVEAVGGAWAGGDNLSLPLDHSKAVKGPEVTAEPETLPAAEPVLNNESLRRMQVYRGTNDRGRFCVIPSIIFERYYDAYVSGNTAKAQGILEEHLDKRMPGWIDYEWK